MTNETNNPKKSGWLLAGTCLLLMVYAASTSACGPSASDRATSGQAGSGIIELLGITPSQESKEYVGKKTQFQLHTLLTEQRHPATWNLSRTVKDDVLAGLEALAKVDEDIEAKLGAMAQDTALPEQAAEAVAAALIEKNRIYVYGCGSTGRLAKQMESTFWRPFWHKIKSNEEIWPKLSGTISATIESDLVGEMTGADRALISSLEGFEDLQLIGRLQLEEHGIKKGDVVICVTEGGETSSVIGTILRAHEQWKQADGYRPEESRRRLYFVYNNPDEILLPFERSRRVLEEPGITKINLATGPQAITGSTRMQATTIETYVVGTILEHGIARALGKVLETRELEQLGFRPQASIAARFAEFGSVFESARKALPQLAEWTEIEAATYSAGGFSTYFALKGLITVFIDSTERSPTFRLFPLDTVNEPKRKSWIQVWTAAENKPQAWETFLGRPFHGLKPEIYSKPFETLVDDPYLKSAALLSLESAGDEQQDLYDFSFSEFNLSRRGPGRGDLGAAVMISPEEKELEDGQSYFRKFLDVFARAGAHLAVMTVSATEPDALKSAEILHREYEAKGLKVVHVPVVVDGTGDPLGIKFQIAAKILLNTHSTAVMARLGRIIGNTMTNVEPSNLKLIGRSTYLIQLHVNDVMSRKGWVEQYGKEEPVIYPEANAVLYDSITFLNEKGEEAGQSAEVAFSIIRILESFRRGKALSREETLAMVQNPGLAPYLDSLPAR